MRLSENNQNDMAMRVTPASDDERAAVDRALQHENAFDFYQRLERENAASRGHELMRQRRFEE